MHETRFANEIVERVKKSLNEGKTVKIVHVRLSPLSHVTPEGLRHSYEAASIASHGKAVALEIKPLDIPLYCRNCHKQVKIVKPTFACPSCESTDIDINFEPEFLIEKVEGEEKTAKRTITKNIVAIFYFLVILWACYSAGLMGSFFTRDSLGPWYALLDKPSFTPPNGIFAPVWTVLYTLMAVAAWMVWQKGKEKKEVRWALAIFLIQLVLNGLWPVVFFGFRSILGGLVVIALLWLAIAGTMQRFWLLSRPAAALLVPYLLWVSFAWLLNASIFVLNR